MNVILREVKPEDGKYIVAWRAADNVKKHCMDKAPITIESNEKFFNDNVLTGKYKQFMVECVVEEYPVTYPIATVYLKNIDCKNNCCELGMFTSDKGEWNDEVKRNALTQLLKKASYDYKMRTVYTDVIVGNADELELMQSVGFKIQDTVELDRTGISSKQRVIRLVIIV